MKRSLLLPIVSIMLVACNGKETARADSAQAALAQQLELSRQLAAQKDSLTSVVLEADNFISSIDSQIVKVKGLPANKRKSGQDPLQAQLAARQEMLDKVNALVERTRATANQLAESRKREQRLRGENEKYRAELESDQKMIADLNSAIERQTLTIATLQSSVDSLAGENQRLGTELQTVASQHHRAYYVIGREQDLLAKGLVVREGGANLLVARIGRTLQPARTLDRTQFTEIDQRQLAEIAMPDTSKRYRIVSRQSLDDAEVVDRERTSFRGHLKITNSDRFWAPSRYLIIVQQN